MVENPRIFEHSLHPNEHHDCASADLTVMSALNQLMATVVIAVDRLRSCYADCFPHSPSTAPVEQRS